MIVREFGGRLIGIGLAFIVNKAFFLRRNHDAQGGNIGDVSRFNDL